jgi:uncharacterized protein YjiS (DUF1127 family)
MTPAVLRFAMPLRRWVEVWRERARYRWELSQMSARDFGDLPVPSSLMREEVRRWPWQKPSSQWRAVRDGGCSGMPRELQPEPRPAVSPAYPAPRRSRNRLAAPLQGVSS